MTTDRELRDLLLDEAGDPPRHTAPWDDIVRRGRRHRRVARIRTGLVAGGLTALAVIGAVALGDDDRAAVVANDPDDLTTTTTPRSTTPAPMGSDITAARAVGVFVTLLIPPSDPATGFDPCVDSHPRITESPSEVTVELVPASFSSGLPWAACHASPFSGWGFVELTDPLDDRQLVDGFDGAAIHVVSNAELLLPAALPEPFDLERRDESTQIAYEGVAVDAWTFSWTADDLVLNVSRWALDGEHPEGCGGGQAVEVRGLTGHLCTNESSSLLSWVDDTSIRIIELVDVGGDPRPDGFDLVAIADALEPLG